MVAGKVLNVMFTSYVSPSSEPHLKDKNETGADGIGSFQIRYKAFDPHRCGRPEQIENGYTVNKGRKVGQTVFYHCHPPYDLIGDSELHCIITDETPVPKWSNKTPKCVIQDCTEGPTVKQGSHGAIASQDILLTFISFQSPAFGEIVTQPNHQIKAKEETGFYLEYSIVSSSCPKPKAPENGEVIGYSTDLGSSVAYRCNPGFVLKRQNNLKMEKKKAKESLSVKDGFNVTETKEKSSVPKHQLIEPVPSSSESAEPNENNPVKKSEKEPGSGPKSEPHLLQVIPPKMAKRSHLQKKVAYQSKDKDPFQ
ncbi:CUB and sushi domain-containing protein 1 [Caerostris extrusa]|uniref:CUB and sushi domain-containing protein 1 n=1 Tax=Caerostris extrusa TaxID=172846 RepID=A0AAV4XMH4_CAEEX|nr:CUB and sushi domain-containing protein 1 [Caerostris extrusa]